MTDIRLFMTTTRFAPTEDGDREVLDTDELEDTADSTDPDEVDTIIRQLRNAGVEFRAWADPVMIRPDSGGTTARAASVDVYVHPGEGWHEEVCADVTASDQRILEEIIRRVDER